ncbi:MAG: hypothetical protein HC879_13865 [Leptolyngbyaceae cyanobacterium SL_5_9]|nr:hypothetical protein [Leptolyngbyaceae cyanobacterium SL_5_9]NJO73601.1 hypothetical protein [Leptolyngbyaceae cyanobacterium RM1_406_9]
MKNFKRWIQVVSGGAIAILLLPVISPVQAQDAGGGDRFSPGILPLPDLDHHFQSDIASEAIPPEELPPPLENGVLFRMIERRPPLRERFPVQQVEVHLMEDGRMFVFQPNRGRSPMGQVEPAVLEQFKQLLQNPEFRTYNGTSWSNPHQEETGYVMTLSSASVTIQLEGQFPLAEALLPDSVVAVMNTFGYMLAYVAT